MRKLKLLLNAEAFGYGPSSAIADFFPHLKERFEFVAYAGAGHTLDLQGPLPYDAVYPLQGTADEMGAEFRNLVTGFDGFVTALDFQLASFAAERKIPTVIYDPLTWFWKELPEVLGSPEVLYLAQDFYGVSERLKESHGKIANSKLIPPLVTPLVKRVARESEGDLLLVNLGGLVNPFWKFADCVHYAEFVVRAAKNGADATGMEMVILGNQALRRALPQYPIQTVSRSEMPGLLRRTRVALATSGLGNIYESAAYGIPTLFLPPPGDSHGRQLELLIQHDAVDDFIDWASLGLRVNYCDSQDQVIQRIAENGAAMNASTLLQGTFEEFIRNKISALVFQSDSIALRNESKTTRLFLQFGRDGLSQVVKAIEEFL